MASSLPIRFRTTIACAILVAACGAAAFVLAPRPAAAPAATRVALGPDAQVTLAVCREHVAMIHDVQWAAACVAHARGYEARRADCLRTRGPQAASECAVLLGTPDDSPDCMLPNDSAARLNAALATAENRCIDQARAEDGTVRPARLGWLRH